MQARQRLHGNVSLTGDLYGSDLQNSTHGTVTCRCHCRGLSFPFEFPKTVSCRCGGHASARG